MRIGTARSSRRSPLAASSIGEVHQREVAAETFLAPDAFVVVQEIAAAIEDELAAVDLDALDVMRRVAVHDVGAAVVDEPVGEGALFAGDIEAPVAAPVHRHHDDVAGPPLPVAELGDRPRPCAAETRSRKFTPARPRVAAQSAGTPLSSVAQAKTSTRPVGPSAISAGAAASWASRPAPAVRMPAPCRHASVCSEARTAPVQHVVVGQDAAVDAGAREARQVGRVHPVVDALARCRVLAGGDGRLQVHDAGVRAQSPAAPPARRPTDSRRPSPRPIGPDTRSASST